MTDIVPAARPDIDDPRVGLGRNRNYQRIWFAGAVSGFGDIVLATDLARALAIGALLLLPGRVLGLLDASALGTHFGPVDTIFLAGGVLAVAVGLWATRATRGMGRSAK